MRFPGLIEFDRCTRLWLALAACLIACPLQATDYVLTIGGGYSPSGNQASLEANVLFFQRLLADHHRDSPRHHVFFADGHDATADVQVLAKAPAPQLPASELLASLHRRRQEERVEYRNHRVPEIAGALNPRLIHERLSAIANLAHRGDRLIVYVTSHGSAGPKGDPFNTTIDCWNDAHITAREFEGWLEELNPEVPVVMVMAQCYCGGFAHTIFNKLDDAKGLARQLRIGFFAQQHDLQAAGCRPDIANDDEFSSYFWGAIAGQSRTGTPTAGCDIDGNGTVSFGEAYAYAVVASRTIDIPLRASDALLRAFSQLDDEKGKSVADRHRYDADEQAAVSAICPTPGYQLWKLSGPLQKFVNEGQPVSRRIVEALSKELGFALSDDVTEVVAALDAHRRSGRDSGFGMRGRRGGSGRRELLQQIAEKWPELGDPQRWQKSPLLAEEDQETLLADIKALPGWQAYEERRRQREVSTAEAEKHELREVKFRRLIETLKSIALEKNLPHTAAADIVQRYQEMIRLEDSALSQPEQR